MLIRVRSGTWNRSPLPFVSTADDLPLATAEPAAQVPGRSIIPGYPGSVSEFDRARLHFYWSVTGDVLAGVVCNSHWRVTGDLPGYWPPELLLLL